MPRPITGVILPACSPAARSPRHGGAPPRLRHEAKTRHITVTVNGTAYAAAVEPRLLLADFLRHTLGLTGTHVGCEHGVCGACTVLVDGDSARACLMLAVQADGRIIETVESLGRIGQMNASTGIVSRASCVAVRLLHARHADDRDRSVAEISARHRRRHPRRAYRAISAAAPATSISSKQSAPLSAKRERRDEDASSLRRPPAHAQEHFRARRRQERNDGIVGVLRAPAPSAKAMCCSIPAAIRRWRNSRRRAGAGWRS